jgi:hypothetical protein
MYRLSIQPPRKRAPRYAKHVRVRVCTAHGPFAMRMLVVDGADAERGRTLCVCVPCALVLTSEKLCPLRRGSGFLSPGVAAFDSF